MSTKLLFHLNGDSVESAVNSSSVEQGTISYTTGKFGQGLHIQQNAGGGVLSIPMTNDLRSIYTGDSTVEFFIKIPATHGGCIPITIAGYSLQIGYPYDNQYRRFAIRQGESLTQINSTWQYDSTGTMIANEAFQHIALVKKNGMLSLYVEGQRKLWSNFETEVPIIDFGTNDEFILGGYKQNGVYYTQGNGIIIDEFRVSDVALYSGASFTPPTQEFTISSSNSGGDQQQGADMALQIQKRFISDNAIDGTKIELSNNEALRAKNASGSDIDVLKVDAQDKLVLAKAPKVAVEESEGKSLQTKDQITSAIAVETSRATAAESSISSRIDNLTTASSTGLDAEISRAQAAEASLSSRISFIASNVDGAAIDSLTEVVTAFQNADSSLNGAISSLASTASTGLANEISRAQAAETSLATSVSNAVSAASDAVSAEASRAQVAEGSLATRAGVIETNLSNAQSSLSSSISAEQSRAQAAEGSLSTRISNEGTTRGNADASLASRIGAEEVARANGDSSLASSISSEVSRAQAAETSLASSISSVQTEASNAVNAEQSRAMAAEASLSSKIDFVKSNVDPAALDSLTEIVSAFQAADSSLSGAITALGTGANSAVGAETSRAQAAEASLASRIGVDEANLASEISRAQAAEASLASSVSSEATTRSNADASLASRVGSVESNVSSEVSRAQAAEASIAARVATLEAITWVKESKTLTATDITNGYVDLSYAIVNNSLRSFIGRLCMHNPDFTLSVVNGVTRFTFKNGTSLIGDGVEAPVAGDKLFFGYVK